MAVDRAVTIRLRVSSAEFDAAMAKAGSSVKILAAEVEGAGKKALGGSKGMNDFDQATKNATKSVGDFYKETKNADSSARSSSKGIGLLAGSILLLGPALVPLGAAAAAGVGALGLMGASGILAVKGISKEMQAGTALGNQYASGLSVLKSDLGTLEHTAAKGVIGPFNQAIMQAQGLMPNLNKEIGSFSMLTGKTAGNFATGLISGFHTLEPLLQAVAIDVEKLSEKFKAYASGNGLQKFSDYAVRVLPQVEETLAAVAQAVARLIAAGAPLGSTTLTALTLVAKAINALPIGVLTALAQAATYGYLAFRAWNGLSSVVDTVKNITGALKAYETAQLATAGVTTAAAAEAATASGGMQLLAAKYGALGVAGAAAGALLVGAHYLSKEITDIPASADAAARSLLALGQAGQVTDGMLKAFGDSGKNLGSVFENAFKESNWTKIKDFDFGLGHLGIGLNNATSDSKNFFESADDGLTHLVATGNKVGANNAFTVLAAAAKKQGISVDQLLTKLPNYKAALDDLKAAADPLAGLTSAQAIAVTGLAAAYGTSVASYQAASDAAKKQADAAKAATLQMQMENDAAGLLKGSLDALNGKALSAADAQNAFDSSLVNMGDHVTAQGKKVVFTTTSIKDMSSASVELRGQLNGQIKNLEAVVEANGGLANSTGAARGQMIKLRQQIIDNAVAHGVDRKAVTAYVDSFLKIPAKVPPTKLDIDKAAADAKAAAFKAYVLSLPGKTVKINADTGSAIKQLGDVITRIQQINGKTVTITTNTVTHESVIRTPGGVTGKASAFGNVFKAYGYGGMENHQPEIATTTPGMSRVWNEPETGGEAYIPLANDGRRPRAKAIAAQTVAMLGGHASFAAGGITRGPLGFEYNGTWYSTERAAVNAQTRDQAKQAANANKSTTVSAYGVIDALIHGVDSRYQIASGAMAKLSKAMTVGFDLHNLEAKFQALKDKAAAFHDSVFSALSNRVPVTQVGAGANNPTNYIANVGNIIGGFNQQSAQNSRFGALVANLGKRGVSKGYLAALEQQGIDALPILELLNKDGKGSLAAGKAFDRSVSTANSAASIATNGQFGAQLASYSRQQTALIAQLTAYANSAAALSHRPIQLTLDGKVIYRTVLSEAAKAGRR